MVLTPQSTMNYPQSSTRVWGFKKISWLIDVRSESALWLKESQCYRTQHSYCRHCLASSTWFCNSIRSLSVQQLLPWRSLWILGFTAKQELWNIYAMAVRLKLEIKILSVNTYIIYTVASLACCHFQVWGKSTSSATLTFSLIHKRGS